MGSKGDKQALEVWKAIGNGDVGFVRQALQSGTSVNWKNEDHLDRSLLHHACHAGRANIVRLLLEKKANANATDEDDATPLHRAAKGGKHDLMLCC